MSKSKEIKKSDETNTQVAETGKPRSLEYAKKGIRTGSDFAGMMSALMSDVIEGAVTPAVSNAAVNAGGKLLKVVELQLKYGTGDGRQARSIDLLSPGLTNES